ncbi:MAG: hypothetical protein ACJAY2_001803, partial [Pseudomonadales bacterium]
VTVPWCPNTYILTNTTKTSIAIQRIEILSTTNQNVVAAVAQQYINA